MRKEDLSFLKGGRFLPIMLGECGLIPRRMTDSSFYLTTPPIGSLLEMFSYSIRDEETGLMGDLTYIVKSQLAASFGGVADRERKHLGKKGIRDMRCPGKGLVWRFLAGWLLGLIHLEYSGKGSLGHSWVGWLLGLISLGLLGWVKPEPIVPTDST